MTSHSYKPDSTDWQLLELLQADGRLSFNELGRRVHLSAPAVAERVRRMEAAGVIAGYGARVSAAATGQPLLAFIQLRCRHGHCLLRDGARDDLPEIIEIHKLSGEHCSMLKVRAASLEHFEGVVERIGSYGELKTHIVLSTQFEDAAVAPAPERRPVTGSPGWR